MKTIFVGSFYKKEYLSKMSNSKANIFMPFASYNHQLSIIDGLEHNLNGKLFCFTRISLPYYPKVKKLFVRNTMIDDNVKMIGFINLRFIRKISSIRNIYHTILKYVKKNKIKNIICYELSYDIDMAMKKIKKKLKDDINIVVIIPDIPSIMLTYQKQNFLKKMLASRENNLNYYDGYVLLTSQMIDYLKLDHNKCYVMDALYSNSVINFLNIKKIESKNKTILYTGTLRKAFNIMQLVNAFRLIKTDFPITLELAGSGDCVQDILEISKIDNRIKYLGILDKEKIRERQYNATLLVNPRTAESADAKYSFPSKTIEYMLSGRPLIMSYLPGMDKKYFEYIFELDCSSAEAMAKSIEKVIRMDENELTNIGKMAKEFVEINNNCIAKTKGIIELLKK